MAWVSFLMTCKVEEGIAFLHKAARLGEMMNKELPQDRHKAHLYAKEQYESTNKIWGGSSADGG